MSTFINHIVSRNNIEADNPINIVIQATLPQDETQIMIIYLKHTGGKTKWLSFSDDTFKYIYLTQITRVFIKILPNFVPKGPIENMSLLVQVMAWHRKGGKSPLPEPMMIHFKDVCVYHQASMC